MEKEIKKFLKKSVKWLKKNQQGCCHYILDDHLAILVGWSAGYGKEKRKDVIQAKDDLDYGINAGIKVWTSDSAMLTDYDWVNFPYEENGEVWDLGFSITPREKYKRTVKWLLEQYKSLEDLELSDSGLILREVAV